MFYSIENRSPYLDSRLFGFAYSIPNEYLINDGFGKFILRESAKGILNEKVRTDRQKKGFNASINSLINFNQKANRDKVLDGGKVFKFVEKEKIEKLLNRYPMPNSFSKFLFYFLSAKLFLEKFG
jgi:asparagine synthase (glutamine-hydrolysing)